MTKQKYTIPDTERCTWRMTYKERDARGRSRFGYNRTGRCPNEGRTIVNGERYCSIHAKYVPVDYSRLESQVESLFEAFI